MKKYIAILLTLSIALAFAACGSSAPAPAASTAPAASEAPAELEKIVVGATSTPHGEILEQVKDTLAAGLHCSDALAVESTDGDAAQTYANIIACRAGEENSDKITALVKVLTTDAVKEYIADTYNGAVVAIF